MTQLWRCRAALAAATLVFVSPAIRADFVNFASFVNDSNRLPAGQAYGLINVSADNGNPGPHRPDIVQPGQVRISFNAQQASGLYIFSPLNGNWGIDAVAFNTNLNLTPGQFTLPTGWTLSHNGSMDGFGKFTWVAYATDPKYRGHPLPNVPDDEISVLISGLGSDAAYRHFTFLSQPDPPWNAMPQGDAYFALHTSGLVPSSLDNFITEQTIAAAVAAPDTPEPSTLLLGALGVAGTGMICARRRWHHGAGRRTWQRFLAGS